MTVKVNLGVIISVVLIIVAFILGIMWGTNNARYGAEKELYYQFQSYLNISLEREDGTENMIWNRDAEAFLRKIVESPGRQTTIPKNAAQRALRWIPTPEEIKDESTEQESVAETIK